MLMNLPFFMYKISHSHGISHDKSHGQLPKDMPLGTGN